MAYEVEPKNYWGLNFLIAILAGILVAVILIPKQIWNEQERYRDDSRVRMQHLWNVERTFHDLTGGFTELGENAIYVINSVYDSLADTVDFYGYQTIQAPAKRVQLKINRSFITHFLDSVITQGMPDTLYDRNRSRILETYKNLAVSDSTISDEFAMQVFRAAYDSIQSDTSWSGLQTITIPFEYELDIPRDYMGTYDTTFVQKEKGRETVQDTSFRAMIHTNSQDTTDVDTTWIPKRDLSDMQYRYEDMVILDTSVTRQDRWITHQRTIRPSEDWLYGPLTGKRYIFNAFGTDGIHFRISSPITGEYSERRYLVFTLSDTSHGYITDGEPSWTTSK